MSETNRLGIQITATSTAQATVRQLEQTIAALEGTLRNVGGTASDVGGKLTAALQKEINDIKAEIAARVQQAAAITTVTAAIKAQTDEWERNAVAAQVARQAAMDAAQAGAQFKQNTSVNVNEHRGEAEAYAHGRRLAEYENAGRNAGMRQQRSEAEYINRDLDLAYEKGRKEAEYENAGRITAMRQTRSAADYENRDRDMVYDRMRREADLENTNFNRQQRQQQGGGGRREIGHVVAGFDELARGQRGAMFSTIGAAARDAGLGVGALSAAMTGLVAVMGVHALIDGAETMGKWATAMKDGAAAAGMSVQQFSALSSALEAAGVKGKAAEGALQHLAEQLSKAISQPASMSAEALHNVGISQGELAANSNNLVGLLRLLADAWARTQDGENKVANFTQILGGEFRNLIPLLSEGSSGLDKLMQKAIETGEAINDKTAEALIHTGQAASDLSQRIHGEAIQAFEAWGPAIEGVIKLLTGLGEVLSTVTNGVGKFISKVGEAAAASSQKLMGEGWQYDPVSGTMMPVPAAGGGADRGRDMGKGQYGPEQAKVNVPALEPVISPVQQMRHDMAQAGAGAAGSGGTRGQARMREAQAEIGVMEQTLATAKLTSQQKSEIETELAQKRIQLSNEGLAEGTKAAKQSYADFAAAEKLKVASANGSASQIAAIYAEWLSAAEGRYKQHASVIAGIEREKVQEVNKARLQEVEETTKRTEQSNRLGALNTEMSRVTRPDYKPAAEMGSGALTAQAGQFRAQAAEIESATQGTIGQLRQVAETALTGSTEQKKAEDDIMALLVSSKSQEVALYRQAGEAAAEAAKKAASAYVGFFDSVGSSFEQFTAGMTKALLAPQQELIKQGLTTIKHSMQGSEIGNAFKSLLLNSVSSLGKSVETAIGHTIANALSGGASSSIGELLGNWLSKGISSLTGNALGGAASGAANGAAGAAALSTAGVTLNTAGATLTTAAAGLTTAAAALTAGAGGGIGAIGAVGGALAMFAQGGIVPSAAGGMVVGGNGGSLAILHAKEMVLPAHLSTGIQSMINGGGGNRGGNQANLNYSPTINTSSRGRGGTGLTRAEFSQMMSGHGGSLLGEARNMMRQGWRPS